MTLKAWDALLKKERDQKFSLLRQRVKIQRDLIGKTNQLQKDLQTQVEEERLEVMYSCTWIIIIICLNNFLENSILKTSTKRSLW